MNTGEKSWETRLSTPRALMMVVLGIGISLIAGVWAAIAIYLNFEKDDAYQNAARLATNFSRTFEELTTRTVRVLDQTTVFVKREYETLGSKFDLAKYARDGVFLDRFFNLIAIVAEDGWVKQVNRPLPPSNVKDREHFQVHIKEDTGRLFISKPVLGRSSGKWSVQFTRRINKPDGSFGGIIVTSLDPYYFTEFYRTVNLGQGAVATLVGLDGIVRARRSDTESNIGQDLSQSELFKQLRKATTGTYMSTSSIDGVRRLVAYTKLKDYPLAVLVGISEETILSEHAEHATLLRTLGVVITVLIVAAALALFLLLRSQQRVQDSLRRSEQEAVSASRMKSEFLARMSHELRTPLNGILGFSEYLKDNAGKPEEREIAGTIHEGGLHLLSLVNATLDLAKIEAGRMTVDRRREAIRPLVERVVALHRAAAQRKGLEVSAEFDEQMPETLLIDSTKLVQILNNLVHNAVKFTTEGGIRVKVSGDVMQLRFCVIDTGPGIAEDQQQFLFDRFRQLDSFVTRPQEGSGLGLALAKELAELMGGRVWVESRPGAGSSFCFTIQA